MSSSFKGCVLGGRCERSGVVLELHLYHAAVCRKERRGQCLYNMAVGATFYHSHGGCQCNSGMEEGL